MHVIFAIWLLPPVSPGLSSRSAQIYLSGLVQLNVCSDNHWDSCIEMVYSLKPCFSLSRLNCGYKPEQT